MHMQTGLQNRARIAVSQVAQRGLKWLLAGRYTFALPQAYRTYSPWYEPGFQRETFEPIKARTAMSEPSCYLLLSFLDHSMHLAGDVAECGVYRGGSAHAMATALRQKRPDKRLHLFDTFAGMPTTSLSAGDPHVAGDFGDTDLESVQRFLSDFENISLHPGLIPQTLGGLESARWSFVHIDVDIYQSTLDCLEFFYPRVSSGGVLLFDDYGHRIYEQAEKRAVDEFFAARPETPIVFPSGQALILKH